MKYILILTQDRKNKSVELLSQSLREKNKEYGANCTVLVWDVNKVKIQGGALNLNADSQFSIASSIPITELALVILRTWSSIRTKGLKICQHLENEGVSILNGCDFIRWSHSKIQQLQTLKHLLPNTVEFDKTFISTLIDQTPESMTAEIIKNMSDLEFPLVFKTDEGCRGDGVYLVDSISALTTLLQTLLSDLRENKNSEIRNGFLLQEWLSTHADKNISNYFRINIVDGRAQSAVQFQLKWELVPNTGYKKLVDFQGASDIPIDVNFFNKDQLDKLLEACPCKNGVVGVDVICQQDKMFLLEFNDGPLISGIAELGEKFQANETARQAANQCMQFARDIATLSVSLVALRNKEYKTQPLIHNPAYFTQN